MRTVGLLIVIALVAIEQAEAGRCAGNEREVVRKLSERGALILGKYIVDDTSLESNDKLGAGEWQIDGETSSARPTQIAPGLYAYVPAAAGKAKLVLATHSYDLVHDGAKPLAAPTLQKLSAAVKKGAGPYKVSGPLIAKLKRIPDTAVALVVFGIEDGKPVARSWSAVGSGEHTVTLYDPGGRCMAGSLGTPTVAGDKVKLAWVDRNGTVGKLTGVIGVRRN